MVSYGQFWIVTTVWGIWKFNIHPKGVGVGVVFCWQEAAKLSRCQTIFLVCLASNTLYDRQFFVRFDGIVWLASCLVYRLRFQKGKGRKEKEKDRKGKDKRKGNRKAKEKEKNRKEKEREKKSRKERNLIRKKERKSKGKRKRNREGKREGEGKRKERKGGKKGKERKGKGGKGRRLVRAVFVNFGFVFSFVADHRQKPHSKKNVKGKKIATKLKSKRRKEGWPWKEKQRAKNARRKGRSNRSSKKEASASFVVFRRHFPRKPLFHF